MADRLEVCAEALISASGEAGGTDASFEVTRQKQTVDMSRLFWVLLVSLIPAVLMPAQAQYKLDVKTKVEEKRELAPVKHGVIQHVQRHPQFREAEVGEDYSLWLTNEQSHVSGDSMVVTVDVHVRTPAMLTTGDPIGRKRVSVKYHKEKAQRYVRDSLQAWNAKEPSYEALEQLAQVGGTAVGFAAGFQMGSFELSTSTLSTLLNRIVDEVTVDPTPIELLESWKIGERAVAATERIIERDQSRE